MSKLILLIVGAAWLAVLLPPLVRARLNGSPANSVTNFRRQLNHLESAGGRTRSSNFVAWLVRLLQRNSVLRVVHHVQPLTVR